MRAPETRHHVHKRPRAFDATAALLLALTAVHAAQSQLDKIAATTDAPAWQVVEASDLLEAAYDRLADAAKASP